MTFADILPPLIGGALIGTAATLLLWLNGKVAGICGICGSVVRLGQGPRAWQAAFVAGRLLVGIIVQVPAPEAFAFEVDRSLPAVGLAGLLVGVGTQVGRGCTSGHGVCGISRFSTRSIVATMTFMLTGGLSAYVGNHRLGGGV